MATTPKPVPDSPDVAARASRPLAEPWNPTTDEDRKAVLAHLDALVAHPLFFQSKRYPALLRFVVEQTLAGNAEQVKERSIGMEVFGRAPGYDANADPVVRVTAGEIRKRLAQYYYDPANHDGIRIELPTGSYVPIFLRIQESAPPPQHDTPAALAVTESASLPASQPQTLSPIAERRRFIRHRHGVGGCAGGRKSLFRL